MNVFNIERALQKQKERDWPKLYWAIDMHGCICKSDYKVGSFGGEFMPNARKVLQVLTQRTDQCPILWTASHPEVMKSANIYFKGNDVIFEYFGENPECPSTDMCDFSKKFHFDILLDDKAGFVGATDWYLIEGELKRLGLWL